MTSTRADLARAVRRDPRAWTRAELETRWSAAALNTAIRCGALTRIAQGIYAASEHGSSFAVRAHAAHLMCGPRSVVIGAGAAAVHSLSDFPADISIAAPYGTKCACPPWLTIRRMATSVPTTQWGYVPVASPAWAAVTAYASAPASHRDNYLYRAVQSGAASPDDLLEVAAAMPRLRGRRHLEFVLAASREGSESHLETVGLREVFNTQHFADFLRQHVVRTPAGEFRLDMYHPASMTAVELDGAGSHGNEPSRLRDIRRDTELARLGIMTLRLSSDDVFRHRAWCRQAVLDVIASRL